VRYIVGEKGFSRGEGCGKTLVHELRLDVSRSTFGDPPILTICLASQIFAFESFVGLVSKTEITVTGSLRKSSHITAALLTSSFEIAANLFFQSDANLSNSINRSVS
jgi:hypothetical protein